MTLSIEPDAIGKSARSAAQILRVSLGFFELRVGIVCGRSTRRNAQVLPFAATNGVRNIHNLANVICCVRQRSVQCFVYCERLTADSYSLREIFIRQGIQRLEQDAPSCIPFFHELIARHISLREFFLSLSPWLFAVAREEVSEPRLEVPSHVPADHSKRVSVAGAGAGEIALRNLGKRTFGVALIAYVFVLDRVNKCGCHLVAGLATAAATVASSMRMSDA